MSKIKLLAMALGVVTMFGQISAYAAYPEGVINNGEYNYGPWQTTGEQPKSAITGGYPSQLYTYGNSNQFTEYWHNSNNVVETYSNEKKRFTVNGKHFILLDKDEDGNYFVIADDLYGTKAYVIAGGTRTDKTSDWFQAFLNGTWIYDPESPASVAYWLNGEFLTSGNGSGMKLPDGIIDNLVEKEWGVEGGSAIKDSYFYDKAGLDAPKYTSIAPYKVTQKVSLLSAYEYYTYWKDISPLVYGAEPNTNGTWNYKHWMLRTASNNELTADSGNSNSIYVQTQRGKIAGNGPYNATGIRPCFWLEEDFFSEVVIDLETAGENVIEEIKGKYAKADLTDIYTEEELEDKLGYSEFAPLEAGNADILGNFAVGEIIVADYDYQYEEGTTIIPEGDTKFQWYVSEDGEGFEAISGANTKEYEIKSSDLGKVIRVSIKCVDSEGNAAPTVFTDSTVSVRQMQDKKISLVSYSNFDGTEFDGTGIKVNFNVSSEQEGKVFFLIGIYDIDNKLVGVETEEKDIVEGDNLVSVDMETFLGVTARVIAVDNLVSYKPYLISEFVK